MCEDISKNRQSHLFYVAIISTIVIQIFGFGLALANGSDHPLVGIPLLISCIAFFVFYVLKYAFLPRNKGIFITYFCLYAITIALVLSAIIVDKNILFWIFGSLFIVSSIIFGIVIEIKKSNLFRK